MAEVGRRCGIKYVPPTTLPGDNFLTSSSDLGAASRAGILGEIPLIEDVPGDLGTRFMSENTYLAIIESRRANANLLTFSSPNMRFRGHREAVKFNYCIQRILNLCVTLYLSMKTKFDALTTQEAAIYPTDTEVSEIYHVLEQIRFKEWLLLKDDNIKWFI